MRSSTVLIRKGGERDGGVQKQGQGRFREKEPFHSANPEFCSNNYVPALFDPRLLARYRSFYRDLLAEKIFGESTS